VLIDPVSIAVALIAAVAVFRYRIGSVWIVLGGGFLGFVLSLVATSI